MGTEVVERPWAYAVPAAVAAHLRLHGVILRQIEQDRTATVEVARVEGFEARAAARSWRHALAASASCWREYRPETRRPPAGTYLVQTDQPLGAIAVYLCEARSDDGIVASGIVPAPELGAEFPVWRVLSAD